MKVQALPWDILTKLFFKVNMSFRYSKCLQLPIGNLWKFYMHLLYLYNTEGIRNNLHW